MSLSKNWDLQVNPGILKFLKKLPHRDAEAILHTLRLLPTDPYFGDIQKMKGKENAWRRRIGSYRIFYRIKVSERIILVFRLERRGSKTY